MFRRPTASRTLAGESCLATKLGLRWVAFAAAVWFSAATNKDFETTADV
jgi:hypothetical protein